MKVFRCFGKEKLILFNRKVKARGKAHGLYGYSLPDLRKAPRSQRPGHTVAYYFPKLLNWANKPNSPGYGKKNC
jgi:hypothetical protein